MPSIGNLRKRRGVVRASVTRLSTRLKELEDTPDHPRTADHAAQLLTKLETLDAEFKSVHFEVIDLLDESDDLEREQAVLDKHDDDVSTLTIRLQTLSTRETPESPSITDPRRPLSRKLTRLEKGLQSIDGIISATPDTALERSMIQQCNEQLSDYKRDLAAVYEEILSHDIEDEDELVVSHSRLERSLFDISQRVKQLSITPLPDSTSASASTPNGAGVRLPKLNVPTFDGNLVHWKQFWDQFNVAVHSKTGLSDAEKTVYLQSAIKDGAAKNAIEGLSHSGDNYEEAIECLKSRYDRPRLIQRAHVQFIVDAPPMKEGSGKELRALHDTVQQHVHALKTLGCDLPGKFITSMIELKLDVNTLFEWQKHSQTSTEVPHYQDLLKFLDLRAQASETSNVKKTSRHDNPRRQPGKAITSFITSAGPTDKNCVVCKKEKHPLYICPRFKSLSHEEKMAVLRDNNLCRNCLQSGHFQRNCKSNHKCKVCQKLHHTLLHAETHVPDPEHTNVSSSHASVKLRANTLLMTCRVLILAPDGSSIEVRALLDNASTASFISERLVQSLSLPRTNQSIRISGIGGLSHKAPIQSISNFRITSVRSSKRVFEINAVVIPRVSCDLPSNPITLDSKWDHLSDLTLADPSLGQPGRIDLLLGVDVFVDILRDGRRKGPPGSPTAFETDFGWVLGGSTGPLGVSTESNFHVSTFHTTALSGDDVLRKFWEIEESPSDQARMSAEERAVVHHFDSSHKRSKERMFIVPLPKDPNAKPIGELRSQAVRRFFSLELSLNSKGCFRAVMQEYVDLGHTEVVPVADLGRPTEQTYLPMHAVYKSSSSSTKIRAVFDALARSSTGTSLNDTLLVGPTVHPPLVDVLLYFQLHPVALTADVSKMYQAVKLAYADKDLHWYE